MRLDECDKNGMVKLEKCKICGKELSFSEMVQHVKAHRKPRDLKKEMLKKFAMTGECDHLEELRQIQYILNVRLEVCGICGKEFSRTRRHNAAL